MAAREFMERATLDALEQTSDKETSNTTQHSISERIQHSVSETTHRSVSETTHRSVSEPTGHSMSRGTRHSASDTMRQSDSIRQSRGHSASQLKHSQSMFMQRQQIDENDNQRGADRQTVMHSVKQKLSSNLEHYSNVLHGLALPLLFGKTSQRSRSNSRTRRRSRTPNKDNENGFLNDRCSDDEEYVFVENIELYQLDGLLLGSQKEVGRGHCFQMMQLKAPSWCDKCGDFIWGAYKQCLHCKRKCQFIIATIWY